MVAKKVAKNANKNTDIDVYYDISSNNQHNVNLDLHHKKKMQKNAKKVAKKYLCNVCDYVSCNKYNYDKHLLSNKHNEKIINVLNKYNCVICNFHSDNKYNYNKHIESFKHIEATHHYDKEQENEEDTIEYSLKNLNKKDIGLQDNVNGLKNEIFLSIMGEIKVMMSEQNKIITEIANKPTNITNNNNTQTNNQQFNMNVFLNETCKDAMNMSEFIENLQVSMEDMEKTGELGFAKGMSRIIMNNLNAIDVYKRPIHCSDAKRETLYVKNNGVWEKETEERKRTKEVIYRISSLNVKQLLKWRDLPRNKGYEKSDHKKNDEFTKLVMEVNKLREEEIDKVITAVSKHVAIDKDKVKVKMSGYLD
jgi:hypothetical protein